MRKVLAFLLCFLLCVNVTSSFALEDNPELDEIKKDYDWLKYDLPEYDRKKDYLKEEIDKLIENNKHYIIYFYSRFIKYMENMIKVGREKGYTLISFMGP